MMLSQCLAQCKAQQPVMLEPLRKRSVLMPTPESLSDEEEDSIEKSVERYTAEPFIDMEDYPQQ